MEFLNHPYHSSEVSLHLQPNMEVHITTTELFSSSPLWWRRLPSLEPSTRVSPGSLPHRGAVRQKIRLRTKKKNKHRNTETLLHLPPSNLFCFWTTHFRSHSHSGCPPTASESNVWISISRQHRSVPHSVRFLWFPIRGIEDIWETPLANPDWWLNSENSKLAKLLVANQHWDIGA